MYKWTLLRYMLPEWNEPVLVVMGGKIEIKWRGASPGSPNGRWQPGEAPLSNASHWGPLPELPEGKDMKSI